MPDYVASSLGEAVKWIMQDAPAPTSSCVGRGLFTHEDVGAVHRELRERLAGGGGTLHAIYYCPHHPDDSCLCRKTVTPLRDVVTSEGPTVFQPGLSDIGRSDFRLSNSRVAAPYTSSTVSLVIHR